MQAAWRIVIVLAWVVRGGAADESSVDAPQASIGEKGFALRTRDGAFAVKIRALVQADGRAYLENQGLPLTDTFELRRVRPILEATFFDLVDVKIMPDFGEGKVQLFDAYADVRFAPWLKIRAGQVKPPLGLERVQSA